MANSDEDEWAEEFHERVQKEEETAKEVQALKAEHARLRTKQEDVEDERQIYLDEIQRLNLKLTMVEERKSAVPATSGEGFSRDRACAGTSSEYNEESRGTARKEERDLSQPRWQEEERERQEYQQGMQEMQHWGGE